MSSEGTSSPPDFPYMVTAGTLPRVLDKIRPAGTPPRFTIDFLRTTLGFKSSNDRSVIGVLKALGMLADDGTPTARYNEYKDARRSGAVLAQGLREGWAEVFLVDENAHDLDRAELKGIFQRITGKSERVSDLMANTFLLLAARADWSGSAPDLTEREAPPVDEEVAGGSAQDTDTTVPPGGEEEEGPQQKSKTKVGSGTLTLRNDIHVHLPSTPDRAVYTAIFRALREELLNE